MSPLRMLILGVLFYYLFRLLFGGRRQVPPRGGGRPRRHDDNDTMIQDVLVEDPVCHIYVPKGQAVASRHENQIHYFCSEKCRKIFFSDKGAKQ